MPGVARLASTFFCLSALAGMNVPAFAQAWQPPAGLQTMPIWPGAALDLPPGQPTERVEAGPRTIGGLPTTFIYDVSRPTLTVYPPKGVNRKAAIIVFPGGGFRLLAIDLEGTEICDWITSQGLTCLLLRYRVPKSDMYGDPTCQCQVTPKVLTALQDAQRAIRLTRSKAKELNVDPAKIGVIGFSAGGYLVAQTSTIFEPAYKHVDAVDQVSSRPDFAIAAYPGHLCEDGRLNATIHVTERTPPTFLVQDWDDSNDDVCNSTVYAHELAKVGVPAELHLFAKGDHAFALRHIGYRVEMWPRLVEGWLTEAGIL